MQSYHPVGIYLLKVNNRNTATRCELFSKLTIKTPERRHWRRTGIFIVDLKNNLHLVLLFLLLTLNMQLPAGQQIARSLCKICYIQMQIATWNESRKITTEMILSMFDLWVGTYFPPDLFI